MFKIIIKRYYTSISALIGWNICRLVEGRDRVLTGRWPNSRGFLKIDLPEAAETTTPALKAEKFNGD
jgi:hypothetical protein